LNTTWFNREIQDVVELYEYSSLEKLVHLAIKVESQLLKKTHFKNSNNDGYYQSIILEKKKQIFFKNFSLKFCERFHLQS